MISRKEAHSGRGRRRRRMPRYRIFVGFMLLICLSLVLIGAFSEWPWDRELDPAEAAEEGPPMDEHIAYPKTPSSPTSESIDSNPALDEAKEVPMPDTDSYPVVTFGFAGDVMLSGNVERRAKAAGYDSLFSEISTWLQMPDVTIANLESPITTRDEGDEASNEWLYRASPDAVPALRKAGFDLMTVANNHILDYGVAGLQDTIENLEDEAILTAGAGMSEEDAFRPVLMEVNEVQIAVLAFSRIVPEAVWKAHGDQSGVATTYDYRKPVAAIELASEQADLVIVYAHWGDERESAINKHQRELARRYIDAGADLVIGSHPLVLQGLERYKDRWIAYSLGSLVFTTNPDYPETWESALLYAACTPSGDCELSVVPITNKDFQPRKLGASEAQAVMERLSTISENAVVLESGLVKPK